MKVLITGGASGIGKATAEELDNRGHQIIVLDKDEDALEGLEFETIHADVYDADLDIDEMDVLINCAGFYEQASIEDMELETVEKIFQANVFGPINMIQQLLPALRENDGRIINIASIAGRATVPFMGQYCGSKRAIEGISDALRMEVEDVDVAIVEPGVIKTGFNQRARQALNKYIPDSLYSEKYRKILENGGMGGVKADKPAEKIANIAEAKNLKPRYQTPFRAKLIVLAHRIMPRRLEDKILMRNILSDD